MLELVRSTYFNGQCVRLDGAIRMPPQEGRIGDFVGEC
jgi:hypothetical protein